jgi:uncharacterized protein (DUF302 family)
MSNSQFNVDHIRVVTSKPFDKVKTDFERQIGRIDPEIYKSLQAGDDGEAIRRRIEAMAGPSGFMLFATHDHGALLTLVGLKRKAIQYILGNPLFAIEMTRHAIGASLYVPLRALLYEDDQGQTCVEYDRPSSLLGQFSDDRVTKIALSLVRKLEDLTMSATRS